MRWSNVRAVKEGLLRSMRETLITGPCPAATGERLPLGSGRHDDQRGSRVGVGVPHRSTRFDGAGLVHGNHGACGRANAFRPGSAVGGALRLRFCVRGSGQ
ncbi:hypothetical protein ACZ91_07140 [Streptomyces regensis]|nr:hypothetical protein ACZ91_07140 [Streptomyces regensis]